MTLIIKKKEDKRVISAFTDKLAFIPNGVTVTPADFKQLVLHEGTPIGMDDSGLCHIIKTAKVVAAVTADSTTIKVNSDHNFKVGDNVFASKGGKNYAITAIAPDTTDTEGKTSIITVGTALGALNVGDVIYQGVNSTGATKGDFFYKPIALVGNSYDVVELDNIVVNAVTMGQIVASRTQAVIGKEVETALKCINVI